jgi:hypothetical protein
MRRLEALASLGMVGICSAKSTRQFCYPGRPLRPFAMESSWHMFHPTRRRGPISTATRCGSAERFLM